MSVALYMDVHVRREVTNGLILRGVDVLRAQDDGNAATLPDPELLDRATSLNRILFYQEDDLLAEAAQRQARGASFFGVIYAHQLNITIGRCINDLETVAKVCDPNDCYDTVIYLPL